MTEAGCWKVLGACIREVRSVRRSSARFVPRLDEAFLVELDTAVLLLEQARERIPRVSSTEIRREEPR